MDITILNWFEDVIITIIKRSGPSIESCGTPDNTSISYGYVYDKWQSEFYYIGEYSVEHLNYQKFTNCYKFEMDKFPRTAVYLPYNRRQNKHTSIKFMRGKDYIISSIPQTKLRVYLYFHNLFWYVEKKTIWSVVKQTCVGETVY